MTTGPITSRLFYLAWPLVVGNLLQTLYNLADMFWVGRVSSEAVAAVSLMFPLSWLFVSTAMGLSAATIAMVSQHVGAGNDRRADAVVGQTMLLAVAVASALAIAGYLGRHELMYLIGARGDVRVEALRYIEVIFLSLPLTFLFIAFRAALQGAGDTKTAMWLVAISAVANAVVDPFVILGVGPLPAMGVRGAAWATFGARGLAAAVGVYILLRGDWGIKLHPGDLRPDRELLAKLVDVGYPSTLDGWARSFAAVAMAGLVARFGEAATAAYGIGIRYMSVTWTVSGAVGQATATGVGQNLGAESPDRAASVAYRATAATMALLFAAGGLVWLVPATAMRIFVDDPAVVDEGVRFLRIVTIAWGFFGGLMVLQGAFRGAGSTRIAMALSLCSRWLFRIPLAVGLAFGWAITIPLLGVEIAALDWGAVGLWWAYAVGAIASFALGLVWFLRGTWTEGVIDRADEVPTDSTASGGTAGDTRSGTDPARTTETDVPDE
ncbi:MATE efflux family protein [Salinarchaeum sp. Harcht-Bsk1]|uniref:MATE family efflux transporter n=1 Tax=Salinarchaeum sp. Harcht-Bsk1 TaxID=1333523 RepID=UPI00034227E1|nr:MATE efflux family protein [Salinarchaeum sp. Harcht-Bsk1]